jgi:hypothetical protein
MIFVLTISQPLSTIHPYPCPMLNETTLLHRGDITVTDARFMIGSQTFAIGGITSVRGIEITPGLVRRLFGGTSTFAIILKTAAGEIQAYESKDSDLIGDTLEALNQAIVRQK